MLSTQSHDQGTLNGLAVAAHQIFSGAPSALSSSSSSSPSDKHKKPACKRKRTLDAASDSAESTSQPARTRDGPKKKKANRACFHCQKAHLTCDDSRPCQRCIKRGMADNCTEGHRKKAKYLLDEEELDALKRSRLGLDPSSKSTEALTPEPPSQAETTTYIQSDPMFASYDPATTFFPPSEAANLEYSILSTILGSAPDATPASVQGHNHTPQRSSLYTSQQSPTSPVNGAWPAEPQYRNGTSTNGFSSTTQAPYTEQSLPMQSSESTLTSSTTASSGNTFAQPTSPSYQQSSQYSAPRNGPSTPQTTDSQYPDYSAPRQTPSANTSASRYDGQTARSQADPLSPQSTSLVPRSVAGQTRSSSATLVDRTQSSGTASWVDPVPSDQDILDVPGSSVYKAVTKPYDYTEGYHFLMKHLPTRGFEKNDILRIVRALAIYRPSLIALQMPMSEEDEVFVEKCFQRSLVELEKLVSFSGTPTLAWRRTGEICLVGPEFCMLTGWEREELVGRKKYIYELFENQSVVEYWENFANHAFENTTQSVYSHCVLLKPSGAPVPCTFCFSIRRDIMDLPSLVIGQWLPLL